MKKKSPTPDWQLFERMIARLMANQISTDLCVTPNARINRRISGASRQIDVLIDARHDTDNSRRVIVDAKRRRRKISVTDVEAFQGVMSDVGATHGYLVSPVGHTKAALKRAQELVSIRIAPLDRLENFDPSAWPQCRTASCKEGRIFWDGYPEITLKTSSVEKPDAIRNFQFVQYVGKCDLCGAFHVHCLTCDDLLHIPEGDEDDSGHQCSCGKPWFWLASIEQDEDGNRSAELHLVQGGRELRIDTVDRRSL